MNRCSMLLPILIAPSAWTQVSDHALRFFGAGANQQDRVRIPIDDDAPGPNASTPCDLGAGSFTVEFWLRGERADNPAPRSTPGDHFDFRWIEGHVIVDRDIFGGSEADWGLSLAGGRVRFGTGRGANLLDPEHTLEGAIDVLDGQWHHVAATRDALTGIKRIIIDGALDVQSAPGVSLDDLSYPDQGVPGQQTPWGPFIVLAAEKHDAGPEYPSFSGFFDELRLWSVARSPAEVASDARRVPAAHAPGLVGLYRFEEGSGTTTSDASAAGSPDAEVIAGAPGNGQWVARATDPAHTAPLLDEPACPADWDGSGGQPNSSDFLAFLNDFAAQNPEADLAPPGGNGMLDSSDFLAFLNLYALGC